ncbi:MAG: phage portal protein [Burkholderiales bacterium RIFCSPLOWO2_02_FULL_57_36]|nr:MAG: phage portal protein [Burkholderiales bacterium RIFCSPLOWO2_02_FULL_57_36]
MKLLDIFRRKSVGASGDPLAALTGLLLGSVSSKAGVTVNRETALRVGAVFLSIRVIAEGVAQVPFKLLQELPSPISRHPQRRNAIEHPLYDLLHRQPNSWQTSFEYREMITMHAALTGRAVSFINRVDVGSQGLRIAELIPLDPGRVTVKQNADWSLTYTVQGANGVAKEFPQESIWHLRGPSWNGVDGLDVLQLAREAVGLSIATEESQAKLHANGVQPSGLYSVDSTLDEGQYKTLKKWIEDNNAGAKRGGIMLLDRAAKFTSQVMTGVDAQHLETRGHQIEEVARFFRVLPIMLGYSGGKAATYASSEQMFLAHMVHTLMPWYERIQQSADVNLLTRAERQKGYYTKLVEAGMLRGALKDTAEYLYRMTMGGIMDRNEARGKLDLNPIEGLDEPLTPTNMTNDPSGAPAGQGTSNA